ncbi:Reverse transcriptase from mobile element jockey protein [Ceratobasidium theobromae]|uniref:Reverse transcriptase from mobile element jockey protein n=1 Tax=Ceratobasidium theobromae TaxID=1582974 RepID=A0A5N5Q7I2_9AGAM|nr:Reverse transcriptase from mobile element jockey protein [Ceratobasidium theobromae]
MFGSRVFPQKCNDKPLLKICHRCLSYDHDQAQCKGKPRCGQCGLNTRLPNTARSAKSAKIITLSKANVTPMLLSVVYVEINTRSLMPAANSYGNIAFQSRPSFFMTPKLRCMNDLRPCLRIATQRCGVLSSPLVGPIGHAKSITSPDERIYGTTASSQRRCIIAPNTSLHVKPGVVFYYRICLDGVSGSLATDFTQSSCCLAVHVHLVRIINIFLHGDSFNSALNSLLDQPMSQDSATIIAGDFNIKHPLWDLAESTVLNNLSILNPLNTATRRGLRGQQDSIIDLTIGNPAICDALWVSDWECSASHAICSDHNCITWSLKPSNPVTERPPDLYQLSMLTTSEWIEFVSTTDAHVLPGGTTPAPWQSPVSMKVLLRNFCGQICQMASPDSIFKLPNYHLVSDPQRQSEAFRRNFFPDFIPPVDCHNPLGLPEHPTRPHLPISQDEVKFALDHSSNSSSLFNGCLDLGYHPQCFKVAIIATIPKPNKPDILEKIVASRLLFEVGKHNLTPYAQFGGCGNSSCIDTGLSLSHDIHTTWSHKLQASLLTPDIKGYFNNINHDCLIFAVERMGFPPQITKWLQSYLSQRNIRFRLNEYLGGPATLPPVEVPQGSPMSPVLWSFYTLPLLYLFADDPNVSVRAFVDDFSILATDRSFTLSTVELTDAVEQACLCLKKIGLEFDTDKSELIHFARSRAELATNPPLYLTLPNGTSHIVRAAKVIRWLGFFLDCRLDFKDHTRKMAIKGLSIIASLKMLANCICGLSVDQARILYKTSVLPILSYGSPIRFRPNSPK